MSSKLTLNLIAVIGTVLFTQASLADRADRRQVHQRARIADGVKSGELTRGEAKKLRAGERHVRRLERRAESDGSVTANEAARIEGAQDRQSERIYNEKHDEQKRDQ
ncbi:MAG: hypothetical protein AB7N80_03780 [Bdellovibrionales bacterium]